MTTLCPLLQQLPFFIRSSPPCAPHPRGIAPARFKPARRSIGLWHVLLTLMLFCGTGGPGQWVFNSLR